MYFVAQSRVVVRMIGRDYDLLMRWCLLEWMWIGRLREPAIIFKLIAPGKWVKDVSRNNGARVFVPRCPTMNLSNNEFVQQ